jgi:hypothetical protein
MLPVLAVADFVIPAMIAWALMRWFRRSWGESLIVALIVGLSVFTVSLFFFMLMIAPAIKAA